MSKHQPQTSIGLPVFNGENYLSHAIESILSQSHADFELIISDNASKDGTEDICRTYAALDDRILYFRAETNLGAAWNFNHVYKLSSGSYFKWAAHDDVLAPHFLGKCLQELQSSDNSVLAYPHISVIDEHGTEVGQLNIENRVGGTRASNRFHAFVYHFHWEVIFGLVRSSVLQRTGLIGPYANSDTVLLPELALHGAFVEIPEPLLLLRWHSQRSATANPDIRARHSWFAPSSKHAKHYPYWRLLREHLRAINRADLSKIETLRCYVHVARWARFNLAELIRDLQPCRRCE